MLILPQSASATEFPPTTLTDAQELLKCVPGEITFHSACFLLLVRNISTQLWNAFTILFLLYATEGAQPYNIWNVNTDLLNEGVYKIKDAVLGVYTSREYTWRK